MVAKNILIIDDEQINLNAMCKIVEDDGFRIHCARNSVDATELFDACDPFLVLTDLRLKDSMGGMDGATTADKLHRRQPLCIFVAVSGYLDAFDVGYLLGAVFTDILQKPFDSKDLLKIVNYAWEKRLRWETILDS